MNSSPIIIDEPDGLVIDPGSDSVVIEGETEEIIIEGDADDVLIDGPADSVIIESMVSVGGSSELGIALTIYVDPVLGNDDAPGTLAQPVKTIFEAAARAMCYRSSHIHLLAGIHEMKDLSVPDVSQYGITQKTNIGFWDGCKLDGELVDVDSITVDSVALNVITAQGSPGWTPGEFKRHWLDFGLVWGFLYRLPIIDNTADTITVGYALDNMPDGYIPTPTIGQVLQIKRNGAVVVPNSVNPASAVNQLWVTGRVFIEYVTFDVSAYASYASPLLVSAGAFALIWNCVFIGSARRYYGVIGGEGSEINCWACCFAEFYSGVNTQGYFYGYDCASEDNVALFRLDGRSFVSGSLFARGTYVLLDLKGDALLTDNTNYIWTDRGGFYSTTLYAQTAEFATYSKRNIPLRGWPDGVHNTVTRALSAIGGGARFSCFNTPQSTMVADGDAYFYMDDSGIVTKANYIAGTDPDSLAPLAWGDNRGSRIFEF